MKIFCIQNIKFQSIIDEENFTFMSEIPCQKSEKFYQFEKDIQITIEKQNNILQLYCEPPPIHDSFLKGLYYRGVLKKGTVNFPNSFLEKPYVTLPTNVEEILLFIYEKKTIGIRFREKRSYFIKYAENIVVSVDDDNIVTEIFLLNNIIKSRDEDESLLKKIKDFIYKKNN